MNVIHIHQLSLSFGDNVLFDSLDLSVKPSEWVALLGRSGCGKTTLLKAIAGLSHGAQQTGTVSVNANIAYMAQSDSLLPWLSVCDNVQLAQHLQGRKNAESRQLALTLLEKVGLADHALKAPYELSGGQRQRVALARTLMQPAEIVLMDEPFSAVDAITRLELQQLAAELLANKAVVLITHDRQEAIRLADSIYVMRDGGLSEGFSPDEPRPRFTPRPTHAEWQQQLLTVLL
ncbi:MAG: phosphonate ABC transporter ATP-binding protein [Gammaproteobacteria bacterium]|nr:MAG: phosphonate ABC transporter ATP-binding protein [Gammaproteobacteria bacterium]